MIRVLIVDDHAVVRRGLEQLISATADLELVGAAADGEEAVRLAEECTPDVILMDLSMPVLDGIAATRQIVAARPAVHVIVLTSFDDQRRILDALGAGATGYLLGHPRPTEVLAAISTAPSEGSPLGLRAARVLVGAAERAPAPRSAPRGRGAAAGYRRSGQQADRPQALHQRADGEGAPHQRVQQLGVLLILPQAALWAREHLTDLN